MAAPSELHEVRGETPHCAGCRVQLDRVAQIGDDAGAGALDDNLRAAVRDARGNVYVASGWSRGVNVFDAGGRYLRTLGAPVEGGTLGVDYGMLAVTAGDTLHLLEQIGLQHVVLDSLGNRLLARPLSVHVTTAAGKALVPGGGLVVAGQVPTRDAVGFPLHRMDPDGEIRASFGVESPSVHPGGETLARRLSAVRDGRFWAAHPYRYLLERWTLDGTRDVRVERSPAWFTPYHRPVRVSPDSPPQPLVIAVREDAAGHVWTLVRVANPEWRRFYTEAGGGAAGTESSPRLYDTVIEVLNPACGHLLATERFPGLLVGFLDDTHLAEWTLREGSPPVLGVWRAGLNQPPAGSTNTC